MVCDSFLQAHKILIKSDVVQTRENNKAIHLLSIEAKRKTK